MSGRKLLPFYFNFSRELLGTLKNILLLDWRHRAAAPSQVKMTIEDILDSDLPRAYSPPIYDQKCTAIFEHFYESYRDAQENVYTAAATS